MQFKLGEIENLNSSTHVVDGEVIDEDDLLLYALLTDPIYCAELLWNDPTNQEYGECYRVRDYQYPLWRHSEFGSASKNYAGFGCARSTGKTESIKGKTFCHAFRRHGEGLLLTAPELIHLLPLTDAVEDRIEKTRLTREFLDTRNGKTGFTHRPFGVDFLDGTSIIGRIPKVTGTGVKGQHVPDLIVDEAQDYPEKGWVEVHEVVMKDHTDQNGDPDFTYEFYGVHSGDRSSGFHARINQGGFRVVRITAIQRPGWSFAEKAAAKAAYGGSNASDYRRNILGEPGSAASSLFVTSRLTSCVDQDRESDYNLLGYRFQEFKTEDMEEAGAEISDLIDLPGTYGDIYCGMDVGLTTSPTVITIFSHEKVNKVDRLKLIRRIHLHRLRTRQIREAIYTVAGHFGPHLKAFGMDVTGIGFPMYQELEDDENVSDYLREVSRGYFFNSKVPVGVEPEHVIRGQEGQLRDQLGNAVVEEINPNTGETRFVVMMPMIEASSRYLREFVDSGFLLLPFDTDITRDMQMETQQRIKATSKIKTRKPNAFHILDSMRGMAMGFKAEEVEHQLAYGEGVSVLDYALDLGDVGFDYDFSL